MIDGLENLPAFKEIPKMWVIVKKKTNTTLGAKRFTKFPGLEIIKQYFVLN